MSSSGNTNSFYSQNPTPNQAGDLLEETQAASEAALAAAEAANAAALAAQEAADEIIALGGLTPSDIGVTVQAHDADLDYVASNITTFGKTVISSTDASGLGAQPLDSDLTAIAALTTTTYGRSLLTQADAAAARTTLGAQPLDSDLTSIAALTTATTGRGILEVTSQNGLRDYIQNDKFRAVSTQNSAFSFTSADRGTLFRINSAGTIVITMPLGSAVTIGELFHFRSTTSTGTGTLTCAGSDAFLGGSTTVGVGGFGFLSIYWDGFGWQVCSTGRVTNGGGLTIAGTGLLALYRPSFKAIKTTVQTGAASLTPTKISFQSEQWDTLGNYDTTNQRFIAPVTGIYRMSANAYVTCTTPNAANIAYVYLYVNGANVSYNVNFAPMPGAFANPIVSTLLSLTANDYVEPYFQASLTGGGTCGCDASGVTYFAGEMI